MEEVFKCKYAFDKEDEDCETCDGVTMKIDGKEIPCTECAGYEKGDTVEPKKSPQNNKKEEKVINNKDKEEKRENETKSSSKQEIKTEIDGVSVTCLRYMSGMTFTHKDNYYKFTAEEEWQVNNDELKEDMDTVREQLWAKLNSEVDKQVDEVLTL